MAVDVLGVGADHLLGEAPEGVLHQLEVGVEVTGASGGGQLAQELGVPVAGDEAAGAVEGVRSDAPQRLAAPRARRDVAHGVGDEGGGDGRLDVALLPVVEQAAGGLHRGGGVGEVVGEHLVDIYATSRPELGDAVVDHARGNLDNRCGFL